MMQCIIKDVMRTMKLRKEPSAHDLAFQKLINEIEPKLFSGKAYDMSSVLQTFKKKVSENGDELSGEAYIHISETQDQTSVTLPRSGNISKTRARQCC